MVELSDSVSDMKDMVSLPRGVTTTPIAGEAVISNEVGGTGIFEVFWALLVELSVCIPEILTVAGLMVTTSTVISMTLLSMICSEELSSIPIELDGFDTVSESD